MALEDEIISIISNHLSIEKGKIKKESDLVTDLKADSLDRIEIQMELEDKYKISIKDEDAAKLKTVGDLINYISPHYQEPPK